LTHSRWIDRRFTFDFPEGWLPAILARLAGTHARLVSVTERLPADVLTARAGDAWSIQEHVGHLLDLETLHEGRIDDFIARRPVLRAADMTNAKTEMARHNDGDLGRLLAGFGKARERFVERLAALDDDTQRFRSMHPRLKVPMRPCDMAFFTAEHDDHHLATIRERLVQFG